jgi:hypothetical protein
MPAKPCGFGAKHLPMDGVELQKCKSPALGGAIHGGYGWTRTTDLGIMSATL